MADMALLAALALACLQDGGAAYQFPWESGRAYLVTQGNLGTYSHKDLYALDFDLPQGTPILAARAGRVTFVKEDSDRGGPDEKYILDANLVVIDHGDGSQATYAHLRKDGAEVQVGEYVFAGDVVGYSGATGFAQSPHMHFEVRREGKTVEVRFVDAGGRTLVPREGGRYTSGNKPAVAKEKKEALRKAMAEAALAMQYDVYSVAQAAYQRVLDLKLPESEPVKAARDGLDEIARRADDRVVRIDGWIAAGQIDAAVEETLLSRRRWAATPAEGKFVELDATLRGRAEYKKTLARLWVTLRQQTMFHVALGMELEGRRDEARRVYQELDRLDANAYCAAWARERLAK
jgi:hypothetical protein